MGLECGGLWTARRARRTGAVWLIAAASLAACKRNDPVQAASTQAPEVTVAMARRANVPVIVELPGRTNPYRVAQVRARVDGIVKKREFIEESEVRAGQRLYQIDPAPYRAALNSARAALGKAQSNVPAAVA